MNLSEYVEHLGNAVKNGWPICPPCGRTISFLEAVTMTVISGRNYLVHQSCYHRHIVEHGPLEEAAEP